MKNLAQVARLAAWLLAGSSAFATELYNLDFLGPETGSYTTVFGTPTIQTSAGPLSRALVFDAVTGYEQIRLPIGLSGSHYDLQCDVLVHGLVNSQYGFGISLDTPEVRNINFHGGLNQIYFFNPSTTGGGIRVGLVNDVVYHLGVTVDFALNRWTVAINGVPKLIESINASELDSIRFGTSPVVGGAVNAPGTYAALDNVVVTVTPEPSAGMLALAASLFWVALIRFRGIHRLS